MSCAYCLISEGNALSRIEQWSAANLMPFDGVLTSQRVSELLVRITGGLQLQFFSEWVSRNRDKEKLPQVNALMVRGIRREQPRQLEGAQVLRTRLLRQPESRNGEQEVRPPALRVPAGAVVRGAAGRAQGALRKVLHRQGDAEARAESRVQAGGHRQAPGKYVALILSSRIKVVMNEAGWYKNCNMQQVVDEMKALRAVKIDGRRINLVSVPTAFQDKIIKLFGLKL